MSTSTNVYITCDGCTVTTTTKGRYTEAGWLKVNIELWDYSPDGKGAPCENLQAACDYCPACRKVKTRTELVLIAQEKISSKVKF